MFRVAILDEHIRRDDGDEGFGGEVACLFALESLELRANGVVLVVFSADVVVDGVDFFGEVVD